MKFEAEAWVKLWPKVKDGEIKEVKVLDLRQKQQQGYVRLLISVPESYFTNDSPTIKVDMGDREPEEWAGYEA
jgi:hypothetical protein